MWYMICSSHRDVRTWRYRTKFLGCFWCFLLANRSKWIKHIKTACTLVPSLFQPLDSLSMIWMRHRLTHEPILALTVEGRNFPEPLKGALSLSPLNTASDGLWMSFYEKYLLKSLEANTSFHSRSLIFVTEKGFHYFCGHKEKLYS